MTNFRPFQNSTLHSPAPVDFDELFSMAYGTDCGMEQRRAHSSNLARSISAFIQSRLRIYNPRSMDTGQVSCDVLSSLTTMQPGCAIPCISLCHRPGLVKLDWHQI